MASRYDQLLHIIDEIHPHVIVEIGTSHGKTAKKMIDRAMAHNEDVLYVGYDIFEDAEDGQHDREVTDETYRNATIDEVRKKLERPGAEIVLFKGDTTKGLSMLPALRGRADLIFIDGGHSLETIASDWESVQEMMHDETVVVFDDYYSNRVDVGAKALIDALDSTKYTVEVMGKPERWDSSSGGALEISMAKVVRLSHEEKREDTVFMLSDVSDYRNPMKYLEKFHNMIPDFKVTVFVCPGQISDDVLNEYLEKDWIEVGVHGYHGASFECAGWGADEAELKIAELDGLWRGAKVFRAPNWATNELTEAQLEKHGWISVCSGILLGSWGVTTPRRYIYNCAPVASVSGTAANVEWVNAINGSMRFHFASEYAEIVEFDPAQEMANSWSHETKYGERSVRRISEAAKMFKPKGRMADFGGNDGTAVEHARKMGIDAVVVDSSLSRVAYAREVSGVEAHRADLTNLPFEDNEFECGFCSHTLEHIQDYLKAWDEIKRVCEKGCFVAVPKQTQEEFESDPSHAHRKDPQDWADSLGAELVSETEDEAVIVGRW